MAQWTIETFFFIIIFVCALVLVLISSEFLSTRYLDCFSEMEQNNTGSPNF